MTRQGLPNALSAALPESNEPPIARILDGFEDPVLADGVWEALQRDGDTDVVFLTREWQRSWWESFRRERLLLVAAEREDRVIALAPLFAQDGMVYFVGSGGSDYLDFVGNIAGPGTLEAILRTARDVVPGFAGFRFYHVPDRSSTGERLRCVAARLGLRCVDEGEILAPALILDPPEVGAAAVQKKSLVRHERFFRREGVLIARHLSDGALIAEHLDEFFEQHIQRWSGTPYPSLFQRRSRREFYTRLTRDAAKSGWLRFVRLDWEGRPIAFHFGFSYRGSYLWYKPTFAIDLAKRSPGEVLLRVILSAAIEEGAQILDFGIGDEAFKRRFATEIRRVRTWGLYPETSAS